MYPIFLVTFFGAMVMYYTAIDVPAKEAAFVATKSDVVATNFFAYREAVQRYLQANPSATGTIDDTSLAPYWLPGYIRDPRWTNLVSGGTLYVYSTAPVDHGTISAIWRKSSGNLLAGTKSITTGRLISFNGFDTGISLPASITANAIVMMGR